MFFAAGVGAYGAAMFHLFTHAFFKALLFLGAGIGDPRHAPRAGHALSTARLRKEIPFTFWAMTDRHAGDHRRRHHPGRRACRASASPASSRRTRSSRAPIASGTGARRLRLLRRRVRGAADQLLLLAADLPDLLRQAALGRSPSISSTRCTAIITTIRTPRMPATTPSAHEAGAHEVPTGTGGYHPHESPWTMLVPLGLLVARRGLRRLALPRRRSSSAEDGAHFWARQHRLRRASRPRDARGAALGEAVGDARRC